MVSRKNCLDRSKYNALPQNYNLYNKQKFIILDELTGFLLRLWGLHRNRQR
jgi:hypothetical protein